MITLSETKVQSNPLNNLNEIKVEEIKLDDDIGKLDNNVFKLDNEVKNINIEPVKKEDSTSIFFQSLKLN